MVYLVHKNFDQQYSYGLWCVQDIKDKCEHFMQCLDSQPDVYVPIRPGKCRPSLTVTNERAAGMNK